MDAADLLPGEQVAVVDITNGARLETYIIKGPRGSGVIGINGAAARLVHRGDLVIMISTPTTSARTWRATRPGSCTSRPRPTASSASTTRSAASN